MNFAEKLRELRDRAGLSEAKLAELSGVSFGAVHNYGLGLRTPTFPAVVKLARALGVTCQVFADCEDIATPAKPPARSAKPRKPSGVAQEARSATDSVAMPMEKKPAGGKGKGKRKEE